MKHFFLKCSQLLSSCYLWILWVPFLGKGVLWIRIWLFIYLEVKCCLDKVIHLQFSWYEIMFIVGFIFLCFLLYYEYIYFFNRVKSDNNSNGHWVVTDAKIHNWLYKITMYSSWIRCFVHRLLIFNWMCTYNKDFDYSKKGKTSYASGHKHLVECINKILD